MRRQKQTDRSNLDKECLDRLNSIHKMIKAATKSGTVAALTKDPENDEADFNLLKIEQTRKTKKAGKTVSRATIYRDLALLRQCNAPIKFDKGKGGYYYTDPDYEFGAGSSSPDNLTCLAVTKNLLSNLSTETPIYKKLSEVANNISGYSNLVKRIAIAPRPKKKIDDALWKAISTALTENRTINISIDYFGQKKPYRLNYTFHPYQLICDEGRYFLWGNDVDFNQKMLVNLNDITSVALKDENFELPEDFSYEREKTEYTVKLFFSARNEIADCAFAEDQKTIEKSDEEGSVTISFKASEFLLVHNWIMEHGANVVPISPQSLVDAWKNEIYCLTRSSKILAYLLKRNHKQAIQILKQKQPSEPEIDVQNISKEEALRQIAEYIAVLANIRAHISTEYLNIMAYRDFDEYAKERLIPFVSKADFKELAKKAGAVTPEMKLNTKLIYNEIKGIHVDEGSIVKAKVFSTL